jgi:hypothetical protein
MHQNHLSTSSRKKKKLVVQIARAAQPGHASIVYGQPRDVSPVEHDDEKDWDLDDAQHEVVDEPAELLN